MPLTVTGVEEEIARFRELERRARDMTPKLEEFAEEVRAMIDRSFASRTSPMGDAWPPLRRGSESEGATRRSMSVTVVDGTILRVRVGAQHAFYNFFGTRHQPPRNPLPVELSGGELVWSNRGEARAWFDSTLDRLLAWLEGDDLRGPAK